MPIGQRAVVNNAAAVTGQKNDGALPKLLIIGVIAIVGFIVLAGVTVVLAAVIAAFVFGTTGPTAPHVPSFTVIGYSNSTVTITLDNMRGAKSVKGLSIPALEQPAIVDPGTELVVGQAITIKNPKFIDPVNKHLVGLSKVDGKEMVVFDTFLV